MTRVAARIILGLALGCAPAGGSVLAAGGGGGGGGFPAMTPSGPRTVGDEYRAALKLISKGKYAKAIRKLDTVVADGSGSADVFNWLGYSHRKNGDKGAALTNYQKALSINPSHAGANEYLGELYLEMNKLADAEGRLAVLDACCPRTSQRQQLADAIAEFRAGGTFNAKPPLISY